MLQRCQPLVFHVLAMSSIHSGNYLLEVFVCFNVVSVMCFVGA